MQALSISIGAPVSPRRFATVRCVQFAIVVLFAVASSTTTAAVQTRHFAQRVIPVPHPITSLLRSRRVHRELKLTQATADQIEAAVDEVDLPLWRLRGLPSDKRNGRAVELIDQLKRRLSEILTVRQMDRLSQIVRQALGVEAILEPEVATRLRLSAEQTSSIAALLNTAHKKILEVRLNAQIRSESVRGTYFQRIRAEAQQNITAILSGAQQTAFAALIGRPINLSQVRSVACKAPEITAETWINSSPIKLSDLRGKVTVVHFYAFGCGNCVRSLPYYNDWLEHFDNDSFSIVGIHRPETERERDVEKVKEKAAQAGMKYPVAIDNDSLAWNAWANHTWPTTYLVDKNGYIRYWWYGELNWQGNDSEQHLRERIRELVRESADI
jgi:thiol-disulfide isomerase/thioredoxin